MTQQQSRTPSGPSRTSVRFTTTQRLTLLVLLGAAFLFSIDFSILNVALADVAAGVGLPPDSWAWIISAFALPAAGFTLLFGRVGDLVGRRRVFLAAMILLIGASLLGGFAVEPVALLTARVLQGFATAMALPSATSLLTTTFSEGPARSRVLGLNGAVLSMGFTAGALLGGTVVSLLSWRAAFLLNVPVAVVILAVTPFLVRESRQTIRTRLDVPGAITVTGGLLAVVYGVLERNLWSGLVGAALLVAFWFIEKRSSAPLAPIHLLTSRTVRWGNLGGFVIFAIEPATVFLMTLYFRSVLELSPLATGLLFGIPGLASVAAGVIAGRLIGRIGQRRALVGGLALQGATAIPLIFVGLDPAALAFVIPVLFVNFFVHVSAIVAFMVVATSGVPNDDQGLATGLTSMTQQVGITIGVPILAAIATSQAVLLTGIQLGLAIGAGLVLLMSVLVAVGLRDRRPVKALA